MSNDTSEEFVTDDYSVTGLDLPSESDNLESPEINLAYPVKSEMFVAVDILGWDWYYYNWHYADLRLEDAMRAASMKGKDIAIRYDSLRDKNNFTLIGPEGRIADTDDPLQALCEYLYERYA